VTDESNGGLDAAAARRRCGALPFESTDELEPLAGLLGQDRAEEALRFGVGMRRTGFNLYVLGPPGTGKHHLVRGALAQREDAGEVPPDHVYVHCFEHPDRPQAIELPSGRGAALEEQMRRFIVDLPDAMRSAFESDEYRTRRRVIEQKVESRHEEAFNALASRATDGGLRMLRTPAGLAFAPIEDGEVLDPEAFGELPEQEQEAIRAKLSEMEEALREVMQQAPSWKREAREELREIEGEMARFAVAHQLREVRDAFEDHPAVTGWLKKVEDDIVEHAPLFLGGDDDAPKDVEALVQRAMQEQMHPTVRYQVNLFVDRRELEGAPVVYEDHPTVERLFGRVVRRAQFGALLSDHTMIKPGALHRANGGTLVLDARRLLGSPAAWDSLKRALTRGEVEIESLGRTLGMSTSQLEPEPIALDAKIILIGERRLYYLLAAADPDFDQLFKVAVDLDDEVPWDDAHQEGLARLVAGIATSDELLPFGSEAVGRVVEQSARWADDRRKLSTELSRLSNLLREADWCARERGADRGAAEDVVAAIEAARRRVGRLRERTLERFADGTLRVDTTGEAVGQINGLSVLTVGDTRFGQPSRITASVRLGKGDVVDIEREADLGGKIHTKGVMILASFLAARYGQERPLSVSASLVFEQSYGGVDGDSASMAELCALLSALSEIPIRQPLAITGSVDQRGRSQVIGGVNEKIEGFFDVCRARDPDGVQGVLIPDANVPHLMLRDDVVEAVEAGTFAVYPFGDLDDALARLTGRPAEEVHAAVAARLEAYSEAARAHERAKRDEDGGAA